MKLDSATIAVYAGMAIPTLVLVGAFLYQRRAWQTQKPPQQDKLLRPAGYSLGMRVETLQDEGMDSLILAGLFGVISGGLAHFVGIQLAVGPKYIWGPALLLFFAFAGGSASYVCRAFRVIKELRNVRLGVRGEQAVAEARRGNVPPLISISLQIRTPTQLANQGRAQQVGGKSHGI